MKRRLILMRHAKSSWDDQSLDDFDRPLNPRGQRAAPVMAEKLVAERVKPDLILASSATRCQQTLELMLSTVGWCGERVDTRQLYMASAERVVQIVQRRADAQQIVMVLAHNPGLHQFVQDWGLAPEKFPTAAAAIFELELESWSELKLSLRPLTSRLILPR